MIFWGRSPGLSPTLPKHTRTHNYGQFSISNSHILHVFWFVGETGAPKGTHRKCSWLKPRTLLLWGNSPTHWADHRNIYWVVNVGTSLLHKISLLLSVISDILKDIRLLHTDSLDEESDELKVQAQDCYITSLTTINTTAQTRWIQTVHLDSEQKNNSTEE